MNYGNYDNWKLAYPEEWDSPLVICDICTAERHEDSCVDIEGKIVCENCIEGYENGTL